MDIDVPSAVVSGTMKINGATVADTKDDGTLSLRTDAGDSVALGITSAGQYSARAIPGTYDLYYRSYTAGTIAPRNLGAKLRSGAVVCAGTTTLNIDIPASNITGLITVNNMVMSSTADYGALELRANQDHAAELVDQVPLGLSYRGSYSVRVVPGNYDVYYRVRAVDPPSLAPHNILAKLRCLTVP